MTATERSKKMDDLERIGIAIESSLLAAFDKLIEKQGYANRSEAVRDLIRERLVQKTLNKPTAKAVAGIFLVYDHHAADLSRKLLELQHSHLLRTISSTHIHLDHHNCLEVIILKGAVAELQKIADHLISLKGVKLGRLNLMTTA
jgi:CopG family transcriptional regulator, nickel-responsive regulator